MSPKASSKSKGKTVSKDKVKPSAGATQPTEEIEYAGKWFALSILFAGLAALYYWYSSYGNAVIQISKTLRTSHVSTTSSPVANPPIFKVVDIPGKGKGIVAERDIKQGELVLTEKPLFVVPKSITSSPSALIYDELQRLSPESRRAFLDLSYVNFPDHLDPDKHLPEVAFAIFQTNAVSAGEQGVGIFPRMARLNHGCSSAFNVVYSWREHEQQLVVYALKDLKKGEELLTVYTDTKKPRNERRAYLKQHYGFDCTCRVCSLPPHLSRASDERLSEVSRLYAEFATWSSHRFEGNVAIALIRTIWRIEDDEGYWSERGSLAGDAVWIAAAHSDAEAVREWGRQAVRWFSNEVGADSPQVKETQGYVARPNTHKAWGTRRRLDVEGLEGST